MPASAWAYRPFVSTDAAVADPREVEIELGYFDLERTRRENTIATPSVVLNYGVAKNMASPKTWSWSANFVWR